MEDSDNALQESIKRKGDKSYYYAHAPRNTGDINEAARIEGHGIVTGGDPKLLVKDEAKQEEVKQIVNIRNYSWHDDDDKVVISMPFNDDVNKLSISFTKDSVELIYSFSPTEIRKLIIKPLHKEIVPDASSYRLRKEKVIIEMMKEDTYPTWYSLTKS